MNFVARKEVMCLIDLNHLGIALLGGDFTKEFTSLEDKHIGTTSEVVPIW